MQKLNASAHPQLQLPLPTSDALAVSKELTTVLQKEIARQGGSIPFSRYMDLVLYTPKLGYYSGGSSKLGADGDFTTAPEMSPLFGASLAHACLPLLRQSAPQMMEFGAGTGQLAFDLLSELEISGFSLECYFIVELSGELRARQELRLKDFKQVVWLAQMPEAFSGVVIGNEVLDAMPVELVVKQDDHWQSLHVVCLDSKQEETAKFQLCPLALDPHTQDCIAQQIPEIHQLAPIYMTEVHPVASGFMRSVGKMLMNGHDQNGLPGVALWIDYGFPAAEYYLGQRQNGTLMCHYRHHAHPDPFFLPGLQDITAHVDFTAIARSALAAGLEVLAYTSQAGFLLNAGITELLARLPIEDSARYLPAANAVQKFISPAEMGELFKVLAVGIGIEWPIALAAHDRRYQL